MSLPIASVLALAGVAGGVHLGRSAIGEIDSSYFDGPTASVSYAALTPYRSSGVSSQQLVDSWSNEMSVSGMPCPDCIRGDEPAFRRGGSLAYDRSIAYPGDAPVPASVEQAVEAYEVEPEVTEVTRYAHYPVTREEAVRTVDVDLAALEDPSDDQYSAAVPGELPPTQ